MNATDEKTIEAARTWIQDNPCATSEDTATAIVALTRCLRCGGTKQSQGETKLEPCPVCCLDSYIAMGAEAENWAMIQRMLYEREYGALPEVS